MKSALKQQQFVAVAEAAAVADDNDAAVVGGRVAAADETLSTTYLLLMGMVLVMLAVVERQYNNILWIRTRPGCRYIIRNHTHNSSTALRGWEYIYLLYVPIYCCHEQLKQNYTNNKDIMPHTNGSNTLHDMYCSYTVYALYTHTTLGKIFTLFDMDTFCACRAII